MTSVRLVLVTRSYWPLVDAAAAYAASLAKNFRRRGHQVKVVTALWNKSWPQEVLIQETPVVRIGPPPHRGVSAWKYSRALARWFRRRSADYDLVYVMNPRLDGTSVLRGVGREGPPLIFCAYPEGEATSSMKRDEHGRHASVARTCAALRRPTTSSFWRKRRAPGVVVAATAGSASIWAQCGWPAHQIVVIPPGIETRRPKSNSDRKTARETLASVHPYLDITPAAPLAVFIGRLSQTRGLSRLIEAWSLVLEKLPAARLWLVGEGPVAGNLDRRIRRGDLQDRVGLVGGFDAVDDLLQAADIFVLPNFGGELDLSLLNAMAAGLPIVLSARRQPITPSDGGEPELVIDGLCGLITPPRNTAALADGVVRLLENPALAHSLGEAARRHVQAHFGMDQCLIEHEQLFQRCFAGKPTDGLISSS